MLAVSLKSGEVELVDVPRPQLEQPTDAIVMVTTTAIGHREVAQATRGDAASTPGAQFVGTVVETGEAVSGVNIDDLVVARSGGTHSDGRITRFGEGSLNGGHAEYVCVPMADETLVKTTAAAEERTVFAGGEAALGIAAARQALDVAGDEPVVVMGCDTSALTAIAWLRHRRGRTAEMFAVESNAARLSAAKSLGAEEIAFDDLASIHPAVVITGMSVQSPPPDLHVISTSPESLGWPTLEETRSTEMAIRLRQIDLTPLVSTVLPLDEAVEAYRVAIERPPGVRGVLLKP